MKVYVVRGSTGEYSGRSEWLVKAFLDKEEAENLVLLANQEAKRLFTEYKHNTKHNNLYDFEYINTYDIKFMMDYTGTNYYIEEVELVATTCNPNKQLQEY